jgi:hypothetical protein
MATPPGPYVNPFDDPANNPNTTNVPYLAWSGENLRLVKCWGTDDFNSAFRIQHPQATSDLVTDDTLGNLFGSIVQTNVQLEGWSGTAVSSVNVPKEVINGARTFLWFNARTLRPVICWQDTWASNFAGLGQFKLSVSLGLTNFDNTGISLGAQVLVMQHQWLAGWMNLQAPSLDEVSSINPAVNPEGLGDPKGDGNFVAGGADGQVRAVVTGTIPLNSDYSGLGLGSSITLPTDWAALANAMATDEDPSDANPAMRWDIHDELVDEHGVTTTVTGGRTNPTTDNVVNTAAHSFNPFGNGFNPFSTDGSSAFTRLLVNNSTHTNWNDASDSPTAGPFDPNYAEQTLLPDGQLNAGDAPMPAARIDFSIAPNTNPLTSKDGVGSFDMVSKAKVYSQDYTGSDQHAGNLFTPFYSQWIPATARDPFGYASGVDGAAITNNFNGFLETGLVQDWTPYALSTLTAAKTNCLLYNNGNGPITRMGPSGVQTAAVYTDEHGEARIAFNPGGHGGNGFFFDYLNTTPGDVNTGCDLIGQPIIGTAHISAIARYPYQKVTDPDKPAKTTLVKQVYSLFQKSLSYYPKNYNPNSVSATLDKIIVAHGQDIDGTPFAGETVCFTGSYPSGAAIQGILPNTPTSTITRPDGSTFTVTNSGPVNVPSEAGYVCTNLDSNGNAIFELQGSQSLPADIVANFVNENIPRDITVAPGAASIQDNPPLTAAGVLSGQQTETTGAGSNGNTAPTAAQVSSIVSAAIAGGFGISVTPAATAGATVTPTQTITPVTVTKAAIKTRLLSLRLVHPAHGKAYVMIEVQSAHKTVKVTIGLKNQHGKTVSKFTKTITANKQVKITSSLIKITVKKGVVLLVK